MYFEILEKLETYSKEELKQLEEILYDRVKKIMEDK